MTHSASGPRRSPWAGFTLLELMVVLAIIVILIGIGAGKYETSLRRSREAALKQDLFVMRQAIEQYTLDKEQAPQSLDDLVRGGYLRLDGHGARWHEVFRLVKP